MENDLQLKKILLIDSTGNKEIAKEESARLEAGDWQLVLFENTSYPPLLYADQSFSAVLCRLDKPSDIAIILEECLRILEPKGFLILVGKFKPRDKTNFTNILEELTDDLSLGETTEGKTIFFIEKRITDNSTLSVKDINNMDETDFNKISQVILEHLEDYDIFDAKWYLTKNPEVYIANLHPFQHYINHGYSEGKAPNRKYNEQAYLGVNEGKNPLDVFILEHFGGISENSPYMQNFLKTAHAMHNKASEAGLFDADWYLETNPDVSLNSSEHPWVHYVDFGWKERRDPSPNFNVEKYLSTYKEREKFTGNPLFHFLETGQRNGFQYWPSKDRKLSDYNKASGVLFIKNQNDPFTMMYRAETIEKYLISLCVKDVSSCYLNNVKKDTLVHRLSALILSRAHITVEVQGLINRARNFDIPIIFDIDDYVWDSTSQPQLRTLLYKEKPTAKHLANAMEKWRDVAIESDAIVVSTWPLRKLAIGFGKPVFVIPNSVPKNYEAFDRSFEKFLIPNEIIEIGYFSGTNTHQFDIKECMHALFKIMETREKVHLRLVGHIDYLVDYLEQFRDRITIIPLIEYKAMLSELSHCDIVIAPLETRNIFCDCKSELKLFEAALFSIPVVCSPTATYASTIIDGVNGFLAGDDNEWYEKLLLLIDNADLRHRMGKAAKESILPRFETSSVVKLFREFTLNIRDSLYKKNLSPLKITSTCSKRKNKPVISLVTILHNKANELPEFLRSIEWQLFDENIEAIFVDDLSTDISVEIVNNWAKYLEYSEFNDWISTIVIRNSDNLGNCISRNKGIDAASADIVVVIDADCILSPQFFSNHLNAHLSGAGDVAIGFRGIETNGTPANFISASMELSPSEVSKRARNQDNYLLSDFVNCVTRNISFNKKKYPIRFDELFSYTRSPESGFGWEDVEFGYRLFKEGAKSVFLDNCFTLHVTHSFDGDDGIKATRSAKNFRRLLDKHPDIALLNPGWVKTTGDAIGNWLVRYDYKLDQHIDWQVISKYIKSLHKPNILIKTKPKALRILTHKWHSPHQYELCKSGHDFTYCVDEAKNLDFQSFDSKCSNVWDYQFRPLPGNVRYIRSEDINVQDYDLIIGHFDENVIHPENCNGILKNSWGREFKSLLDYRTELPMVSICHGTPQFKGQYDIFYYEKDLGLILEESHAEMIALLGETLVVLNSNQAKHEWGFKNSRVIWHGFQPSEFFPHKKDRKWVGMKTEKIVQRPHYNGYFLYKKCLELLAQHFFMEQLMVQDTSLSLARTANLQFWARAKFAKYRAELGRTWFYLNFTQRSPMPRIRGEGMMSGIIPLTTSNHDAAMFVKHGKNGFLFDSPEEFCEVFKYIESHPDQWQKWSQNARNTAIKEFHIDRYLSEWQNILLEMKK